MNDNQKTISKECANILLNIPAECREWVTANMPPQFFGALCAFHDSKAVRAKIEFYMKNPDKVFWNPEKDVREIYEET